jgi:hypothetical protein
LDPSCTWIRCTRVSSWYSNGPFNSDLVETFKINAFNAFVLDRVIRLFGTCNGSLLVFLGWSTLTLFSFVNLNFVILLNKMCCVDDNDDEFGWDPWWLDRVVKWYKKCKSGIVDNLRPLGIWETPPNFR